MDREFGGAVQARRGELVDVLALPGFVAILRNVPAGIATYRLVGKECELAFMAAFVRRRGIGSELLHSVLDAARGCTRLWVVTTNDNLGALAFYQRRGLRLSALRSGAVDEARRTLKPQIGTVGESGIPIRDELELELVL